MDGKRIRRNPNFTWPEIDALLKEIDKYKDIIYSKQNTSSVHLRKRLVWEMITKEVNKACPTGHERDFEEIRKKWTCLASETRRKFVNIEKAAGHSEFAPELTDVDLRVAQIVRHNSSSQDTEMTDLETKLAVLKDCAESTVEVKNVDQDSKTSTEEDSSDTEDEEENSTASCKLRTSASESAAFASLSPSLGTCGQKRPLTDEDEDTQNTLYAKQPLDVAQQQMCVEKRRLEIEEKRLHIEEQRLEIEKKRLDIENQKLMLAKQKFDKHQNDS
ncbi:myb/SANT-like DNA-binding domain-containing protein 4 [Dreissena polymorpha]|uniref:myb/SANT-like DNA-binding domain-containing protein 4 n=1 Tax=Dreissena polymorpha TaxID=45954 RepID=UPI00226489C2|nr:myb/SANT-like DNA-binding domain-containing protein 4 [Dreissena polymorpha]